MIPPVGDPLSGQVVQLKLLARAVANDVRLLTKDQNEAGLRAEEVCAAIQRLEWALERTVGISRAATS